ncbi:MAG: phosphatidylserine decarboxylase [Promethearchaeota archaeon]
MKLAQGSQAFIIVCLCLLICSFLLTLYSSTFLILFIFSLIFLTFLITFFRDPDRSPPSNKSFVLSPAEGRVYAIESLPDTLKIQIRMSLFNVHVTRSPISGKIISIARYPGSFWPMLPFIKRSSEKNARQIIQIQGKDFMLEVIQIAGIFARRCVCYKRENDIVTRGSKLGIIRFGSEVDLVFPTKLGVQVLVQKGDKVRTGETPVAKIINPKEGESSLS